MVETEGEPHLVRLSGQPEPKESAIDWPNDDKESRVWARTCLHERELIVPETN